MQEDDGDRTGERAAISVSGPRTLVDGKPPRRAARRYLEGGSAGPSGGGICLDRRQLNCYSSSGLLEAQML